jgi:leucyl/phenylalanyl-tRNA--protein transferase
MKLRLPFLDSDPHAPFPHPDSALHEPDGLLAAGGDLLPARLLNAYSHGIFPWYSEGQPILWWTPDPRMVFRSGRVHLSRRDLQQLRARPWTIRADTVFERVIAACADSPRPGQRGTWITDAMREAYIELHRLGYAHSIEVWSEDVLVGGLYGVAVGRMFFAESMFSAESGGSKAALAALGAILHEWGWPLFDAQVESAHVVRMGALALSRREFLHHVDEWTAKPDAPGAWSERIGSRPVLSVLASATNREPHRTHD